MGTVANEMKDYHQPGDDSVSPSLNSGSQRRSDIMDKRQHPRKPPKTVFENNVLYQTLSEQPVITGHGTLMDLSEGGCRVSGHTRLRKGAHIQLALHGEGGQLSTILSNCEVVWVNEKEFGVKFLWDLQSSAKAR
ncbi:MAG TPA: PilZ domain-containing protein [Anaerolineales bacterium]|jgi:hypothetical protein